MWKQPWGENKNIRNKYNEMAVHLSDGARVDLTLRFRVFDDGMEKSEYAVTSNELKNQFDIPIQLFLSCIGYQ